MLFCNVYLRAYTNTLPNVSLYQKAVRLQLWYHNSKFYKTKWLFLIKSSFWNTDQVASSCKSTFMLFIHESITSLAEIILLYDSIWSCSSNVYLFGYATLKISLTISEKSIGVVCVYMMQNSYKTMTCKLLPSTLWWDDHSHTTVAASHMHRQHIIAIW